MCVCVSVCESAGASAWARADADTSLHRQGVTIGGVSFSEDTERDLSLSQPPWARDSSGTHADPDSSRKPGDDSLEESRVVCCH